MPRAIVAIPQRSITVSRSVVRDVMKQVIDQTGLPTDTEIIFREGQGAVRSLHNRQEICDERTLRTEYGNYLFVNYTDTFTDSGIIRTKAQHRPTRHVFRDTETGIYLDPHYASTQIDATIKIRTRDLTQLTTWQNSLRLNDGIQTFIGEHHIRYDYSIPYGFLEFLFDAHGLKSAVGDSGEDLSTYLKRCFSEGVMTRKNANGSHTEVIVNEMQYAVHAQSNDEGFYKVLEVEEGLYECSFLYKFKFDQVIGMTLQFPPVIHNQFIDSRYVKGWLPEFTIHDKHGTSNPEYMPDLHADASPFYRGDGGTRLVEWDDWFPLSHRPQTQTVTIFPIQIDETNPTSVVNLYDLPEETLPRAIHEYLKVYYGNNGAYMESIVNVELFEVGELEEPKSIFLDSELNVTAVSPMDVTKRMYVRISVFGDLAKVNDVQLSNLFANPTIAYELFKLYDTTLTLETDPQAVKGILPVSINPDTRTNYPSILVSPYGSAITPLSFSLWIRKLDGTNSTFKTTPRYSGRGAGSYGLT